MDHISNELHGDLDLRIELEDTAGFLGPVVVVADQVRDKAPGPAQALPIIEAVVCALELTFGALSIFDVRIDAIPSGDGARFVAQRVRTKQKPPVHPVVPAQSSLRRSGRR